MSINQLVAELNKQHIFLSSEGDDLVINYEGDQILEELLERIKSNKQELIAYLKKYSSQEQGEEIPVTEKQGYYQLSSAQYRLWVLSQFESGLTAYNMPGSVRLEGNYDIGNLKRAIWSVLERHEILRTIFKKDSTDRVYQVILDPEECGFDIGYENYKDHQAAEQCALDYIQKDAYLPFDLENGPLLRMALLQLTGSDYILYYNMHHIISDAWSMEIIKRDILAYYQFYAHGHQMSLPELRIQYKDYAAWQLQQLTQESFLKTKEYWLTQLSGDLSLMELPTQKKRPKTKTYHGTLLKTFISKEQTAHLKKFTNEQGSTLFVGLLTIWNILLHKYTGEKDIVIGTAVAGRNHIDLENQIGFFINTLVLRNEIDPNDGFITIYNKIKHNVLTAIEHQSYPFDRLVDDLNLPKDTGRNAVFDVMLTLQNAGEKLQREIAEDECEIITAVDDVVSKFDVEIVFQEVGEYLSFQVNYNSDLYDSDTLSAIMLSFKQILSEVLAHPGEKLKHVNYLSPEEKSQLLHDFNATMADYPKDKTIIALFEEQVARTPGHLAVVFGEEELTYKQVDDLSSQLSFQLQREYGIEKGDIIGIHLGRSKWSVISILGILKAGGVYVRIDSELSDHRKGFIVEDTNLKLLITETAVGADFSFYPGNILSVDVDFEPSDEFVPTNKVELKADDVAYVIYTSGSTGNPKGVVITHGSLTNYLLWAKAYYLKGGLSNTNFGLFTSLSFDLTITSLFLPIISGGTLNIAAADTSLLDLLQKYFETDISCIKLTPAHISILDTLNIKSDKVELAIVGGEELRRDHISILKNINPAIRIFNEYGPTETTVGCTVYEVTNEDEAILIGRPISNTSIYIVDEFNNLQAIGVTGEICIGGTGLAEGYLKRPELTFEKFIGNPFIAGTRIYKTGDVGRWLPDGHIEYKGRKDDQVKIRGYRVEPGEIESILSACIGVREGVIGVIKDKDQQNHLCAYIVKNEDYDQETLKKYLKAILPKYMLPDYYVIMEALPLSSNGKIDRKKLPEPDLSAKENRLVIQPETETQRIITEIWEQVLKTKEVSIDDSFYDIGGDSLKAIRLISEYHRVFDRKLTMDEVFINTTVASHADLILSSALNKHLVIPVIPDASGYPASDAQQRLWIVSQLEGGSAAYNMPGSVKLEGSYDIENFKRAIYAVLERHEILRTVFRKDEGEALYQVVLALADSNFSIGYENCINAQSAEQYAAEYMQKDAYVPFDLENGPLLRVCLLQLSNQEYLLYYNMHHIISDGWSMHILTRDILAYYDHYTAGVSLTLPLLRIQYRDYAAWQLAQLETTAYEIHRKYWLDKLSGDLPVVDLPSYKLRPAVKTYNGQLLSSYLSKEDTAAIQAYVAERGGTLFMFLIASLKVLFYRYTGQEDIILSSPIAGREHSDLKDQIGFYINTLALRSKVAAKLSFDDFYEQVKQDLLESYAHQTYPFDRLTDELEVRRDTGRNPLYDLRVVLQNTSDVRKESAVSGEKTSGIKDHGIAQAKFDMLLVFEELEDQLALWFTYNTDIYSYEMVAGLMRHYQQLVRKVTGIEGRTEIGKIAYFSDTDAAALSSHVNAVDAAYPQEHNILALFEAQVRNTPAEIAVVSGDVKWSYQELDRYSHQLSFYLKEKYAIEPDDLIGVKLSSSHWAIVAILGILRAGGAYVPVDADTPAERVQYLVGDTQMKTLIILAEEEEKSKQYGVDTLVLDNEWEILKAMSLKISMESGSVQPEHLAYVIYTSGSTGQPKGVMVTHANLIDYVKGLFAHTQIASCKRFALMSGIATDLGNTVLYASLLSGGELHLLSKDQLLVADGVQTYFQAHAIDCIKIVPSHWMALSGGESLLLPGRMIVFGGDNLPVSYVEAIRERSPELSIINHYGPTETTIGKLLIQLDNKVSYTKIPVGKPFSESSVYVVDQQLNLCPVGVTGELLIGGKGVARGYLNKPELSAQQFINVRFGATEERVYRTGDQVRMLPDGNIEFLGRIDNQVKIRGYRIELGDVERAFSSAEGIDAVLVLAKASPQGDKELVAYYTCSKSVKEQDLRAYLQDHLPPYMVPSYCIPIKEFPLTPNGKINRKALPAPGEVVSIDENNYIAPRNPQEQVLVEVWESVLKRKDISVNAGFYDLGGDSIKGILIVSRLKQKGYELKIADLMQTPVLSVLAEKLKVIHREITQATVSGPVLLTPVQKAFLSSGLYANTSHYNQSIALESGSLIDFSLLESSLEHLVKHHDALRMVYRNKDGEWLQENKGTEHKGYSLVLHNLSGTEDYETEMSMWCDDLQSGIDLENGPLLKAALFRLKDKDCLLLVIHHLVVDGVSWRILLEDLENIYRNLENKKGIPLPKKTDSFQRWAKLINEYALNDSLSQERAYWEEVLSTETIPLYSHEGFPDLSKGNLKSAYFTLDQESVELLQTKTHRVYNTEINDILLTALGISVRNVFGNDRVVLDLEGHGRENIIDGIDITRTVGWFTSIYPFVLNVDKSSSDFSSSLILVKESLRKIPHKGIGYGILRYLGSGFERELETGVIFNYLGDFGGTAERTKGGESSLFNYSGIYRGNESPKENDTLGKKLRISGLIVNKALQLSVAYNDAVYETKQIAALMDSYKEVLLTIIKELSTSIHRYLTPGDLTYKRLSVSELLTLDRQHTIADIYRLSPLQEGLFYHWISSKDKSVYCAQHSYRLHMTNVTLSNIRKSYELLISRHSILRTGFTTINGELLQVVRNEVTDTFRYEDIADMCSAEALELYITDYKTRDRERGFEVGQDSLMRLTVLSIGENRYEFIWCNHHILMDGWCSSILINEFYQILLSLEMKRPLSLPEVTPYASYIKWLEQVDQPASVVYWRNYLSDYTEKAVLPFKTRGEDAPDYLARQENLRITSPLLDRLKKICAQYAVTENTFIQSAWGYLLSKYNNTRDVVYGAVVSGRPGEIEGVENMVGLFINTIPLRVTYTSDMKVSDLLVKQREAFIGGLDHHYLNLSKVQSESLLGKDLFSHIYVFENYAVNELATESQELIRKDENKAQLSIVSGQSYTDTHYDFNVLVAPLKESILIELRYNGNIYKEEEILQVRQHFENVLSAFIESPEMSLKDLSYITAAESKQLSEFNNTEVVYPEHETILELFKTQVSNMPDHAALVFEGRELSYKELDILSDQLASCLMDNYGVVKDDLVGIQLDRSLEMSVSIFGILKAGAAYVPMDMQYPEERVKYIKEDSNYKVCINKDFMATFYKQKDSYPAPVFPVGLIGTDAAYGIYTSGSTGNPKGVLNTHAGLYNRLLWMRDDLQITHEDILLQKTPYTFDVSVWELLMPAVTGCQLVFAKPEGHKDPEYLQELIQASEISIMHFVPSMLGLFLEELNPEYCKSLRHIVCSGEALPAAMVEDFKRKLPWVSIHNYYGPTEAAIDVTAVDLTAIDTKETGVSIGKPVANTRIYIVDKDFILQPVGVSGELLIEGVQVARGYLNRPGLNAEKFISSPFTEGAFVYRSGDLAKWLPNGEISYVGRIDNQVKIRGNRIELGEIEAAIQASGYVDNVAVIVKERKDSHKYLVGYVQPKESYTEDALYTFLAAHLPEYMLPGRMILLQEFPLTTSGKVNRNALPDLTEDQGLFTQETIPMSDMEAELAALWEDVLGYSGLKVTDDFFRIGGDSILAIRLISRINRKYDTNVTIAQLYEFNSIGTLSLLIADCIASFEQEQSIKAEIEHEIEVLKASVLAEIGSPQNMEIEDVYPMRDIQKGMAILSDLNQGTGVYHDQFVFQIPLMDKKLFKEAFSILAWKHATLRTELDLATYSTSVQIVKKEIDFTIDYRDISGLETKEKKAYIKEYMLSERNKPFRLDSGLLWRISIFVINDSSCVFLIQFHHAILDGWSLASLNTELFGIYRQLKQGLPVAAEKLKATNRDAVIAEWYDKRNPETIGFWQKQLAGSKKPDLFNNENENLKLSRFYDFKFKHALESKCKTDEVTVKTVLYGAFIYALKLINYESDFVVGMVANNRPVVEDGDKLLGCFLNTVPVRNKFEDLPLLSLSDYFKTIENNLTEIRKNERLTLYEIAKIVKEKPSGGSPFFDIMFNFVNFHIYNALELEADQDYKKSLEEEINEDSFELTNTILDCTVNARGSSLMLTLKLKKGLKNGVTLEKIQYYVETILASYLDNSDAIISGIDYLTDTDKQLFEQQLPVAELFYSEEQTILDLFETQVRNTPGDIALVSGEVTWTYQELDTYSDQLSSYLKDKYAIEPEDLVGLQLGASHWVVVSILGILKAGGAYVMHPVGDIEMKALIVLSEDEEKTSGYGVDTLLLDKEWEMLKTQYLEVNPEPNRLQPEHLAYVSYISGSAGQPTGAMITHANLIDYVKGLFANTAIASNKRFALILDGDLDHTILYAALLSGGTLHLLPKEQLIVADDIHDYFHTHSIDCMKIGLLQWMALSVGETLLLPGRMLIFEGGVLSLSHVLSIRAQNPDLTIINHYGPAETTIGKLLIQLDHERSYTKIPLGKPFSASSVYVVDQQLNLSPPGIPGELLIGGKGVARGYLDQPELSAWKFIEVNFTGNLERVYRTGDQVRMLPDGNIEFLRRIENLDLVENIENQPKSARNQAVGGNLERNEVETSIAKIWEKILEYKEIGIYENFFRIGGDSILVVKLKHELGKAFNKPVNLVDLFNHTTIAEQAKLFAENVELNSVSEINELKF